MTTAESTTELSETKRKLLEAGVKLMRTQGYNATTVDEICAEAKVTKGGFFHYFKSKEELAKAAVTRFHQSREDAFAEADFRKLADPLERIYGRLDFAQEFVSHQSRPTMGCLIGTFAQEISFTHPKLRNICQVAFQAIADNFEKDIVAAKAMYAPKADFNPRSVANFYVTIFQGSYVLAKAAADNALVIENLEQFRRYLQGLFGRSSTARS